MIVGSTNDNIVPPITECRQPTGVEAAHDSHNNDDENDGDNNIDSEDEDEDDDDEDQNDEVEVADQTPGFQENDMLNDGAVTPDVMESNDEARSDAPDATGLDNHLEVPAEIAGVENDDQVA
jgi:hypothetical protein